MNGTYTLAPAPDPAPRFRGTAFGLDIHSHLTLAGVPEGPGPGPRLDIERATTADREWPTGAAETLAATHAADGSGMVVQRHPQRGYRVQIAPYGTFFMSIDGARLRCDLAPDLPRWQQERTIIAQLLPLAALLAGLEGFHAGAVLLDDRLVALTGPSGAGKSTLTLMLAARGATFFSDDVLVLADPAAAVFHPGPQVANVHDPELLRLARDEAPPFKRIIATTDTSARVVVEGSADAAALTVLYLIDRRLGADNVTFETMTDPFALMASTFNVAIRDPARLESQLDACAAIAAAAPMIRTTAPPAISPAGLVDELARHAENLA